MKLNFSLINLGCTKNLVDSQYFLGRLFDMSLTTPNYKINYFTDPFDPATQIVFLNTCGFISSAREEAQATVRQLVKAKKTVYILGCAAQYFKKLIPEGNNIFSASPHVHYLSRGDLHTVTLPQLLQGYDSTSYWPFVFAHSPRVYTNLAHKFEYLKIAEGCDNHCTFCIIPAIRGPQQSLPIEQIVQEAKQMIANGIQEIILIAQDTTRYGTDLYGEPKLLELLQRLDTLPGDFTYRLLYLYPDIVTLHHIKQLKKLKKFLPYFDIPLQHISSSVLKKMGRFYDESYIIRFIDTIKKTFPVRFIRTNLIIGFPGETQKDFTQLMNFVKTTQFDAVALFEYHDEPLAASSALSPKVPDTEIRKRFTKIQQLVDAQGAQQHKATQGIAKIGYIMDIQHKKARTIVIVRPQLHCPEIDRYDEIPMKNILGNFDATSGWNIGDKILYIA